MPQVPVTSLSSIKCSIVVSFQTPVIFRKKTSL